MRVHLAYGRDGLDVDLPDRNVVAVLESEPALPLPDPRAAVERALARPVGGRPLADLARGQRDACIVVCDITRPVPNPVLLPPVLQALEAGGLSRERVTLLVATGTHRPNTPAELDEMLGPETARTVRVVNHACADVASHRDLGVTPAGTPVLLDRTYLDAALKLTVGFIEPHFMAGYSGGRKLVMPGVAALETIQAWHHPRFLEHPAATNGVVDGNPVHEEALAIARMVPPDLILDVVLDEQRRITGVFAGDLEAAWREGVAFAERHSRAAVPEPADIVLTTCAGYPLDATLYQAVKGMVGAMPAAKPGGSVVIAAECSEGVGGPHFRRMLEEWDDLQAFREAIQQPGWTLVPDQWEVEMMAKAAEGRAIHMVCGGIDPDLLARLCVRPAASVEQAIERALAEHGADARIAVIPRGPYVIPQLASA